MESSRRKKKRLKRQRRKRRRVRRTIKRVLRNIAIFFVALLAVLFLCRKMIMDKALDEGLKHVIAQARGVGIQIHNIDVKEMSPIIPDTIRLYNIKSDLSLPNKMRLETSFSELKMKMNFTYYIFEAKGQNFVVKTHSVGPENSVSSSKFTGRISSPRIRVSFMVSKDNPQKTAQMFISQLNELLATGHTALNISFKGTLTFPYKGDLQEAQIKTVREDDITSLLLDKESVLELIGSEAAKKLTEAELEVIASNPLRASKLLEIQDYVRREVEKKSLTPNFPQDAYRHVLWNFLLTNAFNEQFAKEVTDAHELGSSNSSFDTDMDYNNNALGRKYALLGLTEAQLTQKVLTDPNIIRADDR